MDKTGKPGVHQQVKDEQLVRQYISTRRNEYFDTLYKRYVGKVYRRCLSLTKDPAKAEDYTHDIFLRVFISLIHFKEQSAFSTWLYSISYNYCMDQLRLNNRTATVSIEDGADYNIADTDDYEVTESQLQQLAHVMEAMSPDEVNFLRLKYVQGMDIREIAQQFNLKDSAVKMRLKRTRDKIRKLYTDKP